MGVSIRSAYKPVEVDLWADDGGGVFVTIDAVRSAQKKLDALSEKLAQTGDTEVLISVVGEMLDIRLKPVGAKKVKPSTIIKKKWEADIFTVGQLLALLQDVEEQESEAVNPT